MAATTRWGILGTGAIARKFATGLEALHDAALVAVGSRHQSTADEFGDRFGVPRRYADYEALAADPDVDAVYVATPHSLHRDNTMLCLGAGKAVLCEKPFAINAAQAGDMIRLARQTRVFLMEAMWTRYLPCMVKLRELLDGGAVGEVRMIHADFGFRAEFRPEARLFDPALGGGALLDVGVYTVSLASMVLGEPADVATLADLGETGVDEQSAFILRYAGGQLAVLSTAVRTTTPMEATIIGTEGYIRVHPQWWCGQALTLSAGGREPQHVPVPFEGNGYNYEAAEVGRCLRAGQTESAVMPLDETLSVMRTLDRIRAAWGLRYPME